MDLDVLCHVRALREEFAQARIPAYPRGDGLVQGGAMSDSLAKRYGIGCGGSGCPWGPIGGMTVSGCRCFDTYQMTAEQLEERRRTRKGIHALRMALAADPDMGLALDQLVLAVRVKEAGATPEPQPSPCGEGKLLRLWACGCRWEEHADGRVMLVECPLHGSKTAAHGRARLARTESTR